MKSVTVRHALIAALLLAVVGLSAALAFAGRSSGPRPTALGHHGVYVVDAGTRPFHPCGRGQHCPADRARQVATFVLRATRRADVLISAIVEANATSPEHATTIGVFATLDGRQATAGGQYAQEDGVAVTPGPDASATVPYQALVANVPAGRHRIALLTYAGGGMRFGPVSLIAHALQP